MKRIFFSDGGKGGVGKSFVSICLIDYLLTLKMEPCLIEADLVNPDVGRLFNKHSACAALFLNLSQEEDWLNLTLDVENYASQVNAFVINLPAGQLDTRFLKNSLLPFQELGFKISTLFTINRHVDSLNLLEKSLQAGLLSLSDERIVVLNGLYGQEEDFTRFNDSDVKHDLIKQGGHTLYLPELFYRSADLCLLEKKKTFSEILNEPIQLGYRYQIMRWITDIHCRLDRLLDDGKNIKDNVVAAQSPQKETVEVI